MKLTNNQYFALAGASLVILTALTILHFTPSDILVGILVGILYAAAHVAGGETGANNVQKGINIGVPLQGPVGPAPGEQVRS